MGVKYVVMMEAHVINVVLNIFYWVVYVTKQIGKP